jgi:hypothetical protein
MLSFSIELIFASQSAPLLAYEDHEQHKNRNKKHTHDDIHSFGLFAFLFHQV